MLILYRAVQISFVSLCLRNAAKVRKCVCVSPTAEREQRVSGLVPQRTPPAAAILEAVVSPWHGVCFFLFFFLSAGVLSASESHRSPISNFYFLFFVFLFFQSHRLPPPISLASLLLSHANSLICKREKTSERGREREKWRAEPPAEEGAPLRTHTTSTPHPILSLSSPAHLNKLTPLDVSRARARTLMQEIAQARTHSSKHSQTHTRL